MKIINIESHGDGYRGILTEDYQQYKHFNISPAKYQIVPLRTATEISGYEEFIAVWNKCEKSVKFLKFPIEIKELTFDRLKKIGPATDN